MEQQEQAAFNDWAVVEVMGHNTFAGHVTTQAFGGAVLFRIDVPELPEYEDVLKYGEYIDGVAVPCGSKVMRGKIPGYTKLIGAGSIYAITPCTEETAILAVKRTHQQPMWLLELAPLKQIAASQEDDF